MAETFSFEDATSMPQTSGANAMPKETFSFEDAFQPKGIQENSPQVIQARNKALESQLANAPTQQTAMQNLGSGIVQGGKNVVMGGLQAGTDIAAKAFPNNQTIQDFRSLLPEAQASSNITYQAETGKSKAAAIGRLGAEAAGYGVMGGPVVGGAIAGATQPTEQQTTPDEALKQRAIQGAIGGTLGVVAPAVANKIGSGISTIAQGIKSSSPEAMEAIETGMKDVSSGLYDHMDNIGANLTSSATQDLASNIKSAIKKELGNLDPVANKYTISALKRLEDSINQAGEKAAPEDKVSILSGLADSSPEGEITLSDLDKIRQSLSRIPKTETADINSARIVRKAIDDSVNNLTGTDLTNGSPEAVDALNAARQQWSQAKKYELVSNIVKDADGDPVKIKNGLNALLKTRNELKISGFSDDELAALKNAAKYSLPEMAFKGLAAGSILGGKKLPLATDAAVLLATHGNPLAIAGIGASTGIDLLSGYMAKGKAAQLLQTLQNGSVPKEIGQLPPEVAQEIMQKVNPQLLLPAPRQNPIVYGQRTEPRFGTDINTVPYSPPAPPKTGMLPAPENINMVDRQGNVRPMTGQERIAAEQSKQQALQSGLTPDVRRVQIQNQINQAYASRDLQRNAVKEAQIAKIAELSSVPVEQLVDMADRNIKELANIVGKDGSDTAFAQALRIAIKNKGKK